MDKRYCQNEGQGYCGECVSGDLRDKISGLQDEVKKAHAAGLAEGEAERKELEEKNEYLEGRDRSLLEQHQASMITLGDSDLLAVGGRLLDRAEEAEAKLAALTAELVAAQKRAQEAHDANLDFLHLAWEALGGRDSWQPETTLLDAIADCVGEFEHRALVVEAETWERAARVAEGGRFLHEESLEAKWGKECAAAIRREAKKALSPESEKPAPDGERRKIELGVAYFDEDGTAFSAIRDGKWLDPADKVYIPWRKLAGKKVRLYAALGGGEDKRP